MESKSKGLILCIDDSKDQLVLIRRYLQSEGYKVMTAGGADEAMQVLTSMTPDLILLDVLMPEMNGYQLCAKLHLEKSLALIPVIFLTALFTEQDKARAINAGGTDFLIKPVKQEKLIETVKKYLVTSRKWQDLGTRKLPSADLRGFLAFLQKALKLDADAVERITSISAENLYSIAPTLGVSEEVIARNIAAYLDLAYIPKVESRDLRLGLLPSSYCKARQVVAITANDVGAFAIANPFAWKLIDDLTNLFGTKQKPRILITEPKNIIVMFDGSAENIPVAGTTIDLAKAPFKPKVEETSMSEIEAKLAGLYQVEKETVVVTDDSAESAPIIMLVNKIIDDACAMGASDIHIEPWEREVVVRYRIDGDLRQIKRLQPQKLILPIVARIKIMSSLSITERRLPQDGRIVYKDDIDLRVAIVPTNHGEKVVLRLLDKRKSAQPLDTLGFSERHLRLYREKIQTPYGMILHVGPTGSGKSMTLFSALKEIQTPEINIQTIEDPIEYTLPGISQVQVNQVTGLTFARGLRSFLRQDPDVILVGEIRDRETADVAIEAALTGHLVLSTLHTNDSATTVTRLIEMGVEPYLISSSLILICAQRLLRRLCASCKHSYNATDDEKRLAGISEDKKLTLFAAGNCEACGGTGYKGRIGVHELLIMNDALRSAMSTHGITSDDLNRMAVEKAKMTTLYWDAMEKARSGITSIKEVVAQIRRDNFDTRPSAGLSGTRKSLQ